MKIILFLITVLFNYSVYAEVNIESNPTGIWSITDTAKQNRWLIIHNLTEAQKTGIYHIEVIGRNKKAPAWQIQHIAPHIAINKSALFASIIKPLNKGDVYPETFNNAFTAWQKENDGKGGAVCTTFVIDCMK